MEIEEMPEAHELRPRGFLVALGGDPGFLFVAREDEIVRELGSDETLMVVGRRIDQVPQNLLARPAAFDGRNGGFRFANSSKIAFAAYNDIVQPST